MITLICEDDLLIAREIMQDMASAGLRAVGPARDRHEAICLAEEFAVNIAVIDLTLSDGRSGVELARSLRRRGCAIIVCSADLLPPEDLSDIDHMFLRKPTPPGAIVDCVRAAIQRQQAPRD